MDWRVSLGFATHKLLCAIWLHKNLLQNAFEGISIKNELSYKKCWKPNSRKNKKTKAIQQKDSKEGMATSALKHWISAPWESTGVKVISCCSKVHPPSFLLCVKYKEEDGIPDAACTMPYSISAGFSLFCWFFFSHLCEVSSTCKNMAKESVQMSVGSMAWMHESSVILWSLSALKSQVSSGSPKKN